MSRLTTLRRGSIALALSLVLWGAAGAGAQEPTSTLPSTPDAPSIIPAPNSGQDPEAQGERGTGTQYAVMGLIAVGLAGIILLVVRESRSKAANRTAGHGRTPTDTDPPDPSRPPSQKERDSGT